MLKDILRVDSKTGELVMDMKFVGTIKEFKKLLARSAAVKDDSVGRLKLVAKRELKYIFLMENPSSPFVTLDEKTRKAECIHKVELDLIYHKNGEPFNWVEDSYVRAARKVYREYMYTESAAYVIALKRSLVLSKNVATLLTGRLQNKYAEIEESFERAEEEGKEIDRAQLDLDIATVIETISHLNSLTKGIETSLDTIAKAEAKYIVEVQDKRYRKGHKTIGRNADPD